MNKVSGRDIDRQIDTDRQTRRHAWRALSFHEQDQISYFGSSVVSSLFRLLLSPHNCPVVVFSPLEVVQ